MCPLWLSLNDESDDWKPQHIYAITNKASKATSTICIPDVWELVMFEHINYKLDSDIFAIALSWDGTLTVIAYSPIQDGSWQYVVATHVTSVVHGFQQPTHAICNQNGMIWSHSIYCNWLLFHLLPVNNNMINNFIPFNKNTS